MKYLRRFATEAEYKAFVSGDDYDTPNVSLVSESESVKYNVVLGVFIQHINGALYTADQWTANGFSNDLANGIAVATINASFVIALQIIKGVAWGANIDVEGVPNQGFSTASSQYNGRESTTKIIEGLAGKTGSNNITGAPMLENASSYTFPNGKKGYIPSFGEANIIRSYKSEILALFKVLGSSYSISYLASSTPFSTNEILAMNNFMSGSPGNIHGSKDFTGYGSFILTELD